MTSLTADRSVRATHSVLSRRKFARAISTQGHNVRLAIWLAGWRMVIYEEADNQS
jgi:transcription antitermination factor NusA-like protein